MFIIYALVDPETHLVRYVGQTTQVLQLRYRAHCRGHVPATGAWAQSLRERGRDPILLILQTGDDVMVPVKGQAGTGRQRKIRAAADAEVKWIKRFRRTVLNRAVRSSCKTTWDYLVNPDEVGTGVDVQQRISGYDAPPRRLEARGSVGTNR